MTATCVSISNIIFSSSSSFSSATNTIVPAQKMAVYRGATILYGAEPSFNSLCLHCTFVFFFLSNAGTVEMYCIAYYVYFIMYLNGNTEVFVIFAISVFFFGSNAPQFSLSLRVVHLCCVVFEGFMIFISSCCVTQMVLPRFNDHEIEGTWQFMEVCLYMTQAAMIWTQVPKHSGSYRLLLSVLILCFGDRTIYWSIIHGNVFILKPPLRFPACLVVA